VTKKNRVKAIKPAATREQVYKFAHCAIEAGLPEIAAAAVVCFEFLQRPENVRGMAGGLSAEGRPDRNSDHPSQDRRGRVASS
jgi:hypothetical protein